jgi:hypothetical protein
MAWHGGGFGRGQFDILDPMHPRNFYDLLPPGFLDNRILNAKMQPPGPTLHPPPYLDMYRVTHKYLRTDL